MLAGLVGRCLDSDDLNNLLGDVNHWYQDRGYTTTRIYAQEQDLAKGKLELRVIPGRVGVYRYLEREGDSRLFSAFPGRSGDLLNLRDLEQGLENLNRTPSQESKFKLYPGKAPGVSDVVVELAEKPRWRITELLDNSGTKSMGVWRSNTEFAFDNLLGRNDLLSLGYNRNIDNGQMDAAFEGLTFNYFIPSGYHLFGLSAATFASEFNLPGINQSYAMRTHSQKMGASYEYLFSRDQSSKFSLISGLDFTEQHTHIAQIEIDSQYRRLSVLYLGLKGKQYFGNAVFDWQTRVDQGVPFFGAMATIPGGSEPRYTLVKAHASFSLPLWGEQALWRTSISGQAGEEKLPSLAQLYLGNRYNVRGFQDNSLYSSTGICWRNDLEAKALRWGDISLIPYAGLDAGLVKPQAAQQVSQHKLAGMALGLRGQYGKAGFDIAYTRALSRPDEFAAESKTRWLASLNLAF